jgi:hypothetical protein
MALPPHRQTQKTLATLPDRTLVSAAMVPQTQPLNWGWGEEERGKCRIGWDLAYT